MQYRISATSIAGRRPPWPALLLVAASVAFSLGFACAAPLAAFAAAAALTLSRKGAVLAAGAAWLANQAVGYAVLDYPWTANSLAWGAALGGATVLATGAARWSAARLDGAGRGLMASAGFLAAIVTYEGALFAVAAALLGGTAHFTPAILGRVFAINAVGMAMLAVLDRLGVALGLVAPPRSLAALPPLRRRSAAALRRAPLPSSSRRW